MRCPPTPAASPEGRFGGFGYSVRHDEKHGAARLARARKGGLGFAVQSDRLGGLRRNHAANALMVLANGIAMDRDMVVSALSESPPYLRWCAGILLCMTVPARSAAQEAAAVTQT